jgi:hypothetical protein
MDRVDYQALLIQDLVNLETNDELNLNPWYQRRSVWTTPQKAYLINTLFEQKPIPSLYVRHSLDLEKEKSIREVVDGQQRIRSILEYAKNGYAARHPGHSQAVKYDGLSKAQKQAFRMTSLSVGYLIGATEADVIEIFGRLNSVSKTLNLQEKRNAVYSGEFKQFCLSQASRRVTFWRSYNIFTANDIARMQEVQFVSELVLNMMEGLQDYNAKAIDAVYKKHDETFTKANPIESRIERTFSKLGSLNIEAIRDTIFARAPLFFTLFLAVDSKPSIGISRLEEALFTIDKKFNSDVPITERTKADADFYVACTSNMHRIKSRQIRETYLAKHLGAAH